MAVFAVLLPVMVVYVKVGRDQVVWESTVSSAKTEQPPFFEGLNIGMVRND